MFNIESSLNHILVLFLILMSGSMLHVGFVVPTYICFLTITLWSLARMNFFSKNKIKLALKFFFVFVSILIVNFLFSSSQNFGNYGTVIALGLVTFLVILSFVSRDVDFKYYLYTVLKFIMILSLIGFALSIFDIGRDLEIGDGYRAKTIGYLFYYNWQESIGPLTFYRNQGVFWEPGILAVYANIFLFLALFVYNNKKNTWLATVCILTTFSTTGFFILFLQLVVYFRKNKLSFLKKMFIFFGLILVVLILILSFFGKKSSAEEEAVSSYGLRSFDLYSGVMVAVTNPVFGVGLNKDAFFKERNKFIPGELSSISQILEERGNSNSIMQLFYMMGFITAFITLYMLYKQNLFYKQKTLFFFIMVISLSSEPLLLSPFFLFFIFSVVLFKNETTTNTDLLIIAKKEQ